MPAEVQKIAITVTIHEAAARQQNFGQVSNAYVRVAKMANENDMTGENALRYDLGEDFSVETAIVEMCIRDSPYAVSQEHFSNTNIRDNFIVKLLIWVNQYAQN